MTQHVLLSADGTKINALFAGPQPAQANYAEIADNDSRYVAWQAAAAARQQLATAMAAGVQIVSTGTPVLNGTYSIDMASRANIDGIYAGIKNGDGLPGGGTTFNYADITGAMHAFDATSFPNLAKAIRDYSYALSQGESPTQPVTIP